ncbi:interleukin-like EMT inducer domain-containing protein [Sulfurimonas sp.]|uniref:interleukin-like EMT inducer domain-containing protein n=1 Tax=Sulfurimonas sp. TaxID=2022749 RepID=UPI0025E5F65D|nr:interleukin-like EMT inducer domain-containing protein [Sulfurimonas sp.]
MLQKFILILLFPLLLSAENTLYERDVSGVNLISGTKATDMPYGYYVEQFSKSSIKAFENIDLSLYSDKKLLIGFGTYDIDEENCRYLDVPSNSSMPTDFKNISTLGNETYAVSRIRMSYTQCKALVATYSGYVYTPKDASNYTAVLNKLNNSSGGDLAKDLWVGYGRADCASEYLNDKGSSQSYTSFVIDNEICNTSNIYTYSSPDSKTWQRTGSSDQHYCPISLDSPDYLRPIKFCAPWLRVERSWKLYKNEDLYEMNGHTYDYRYMKYVMEYPKDATICTEIDTNVATSGDRFEFTCNSYDDIRASAACVEQITLPQCHVNTCKGYAESSCVKTNSFTPFKDYDVGYILINGVETKVKTKDNKIVNVYDCPPPNPSSDNCLKKEIVSVIPVECPYSKCDELVACLQSDTETADECYSTYTCERSYGSTSSIKYENGIAVGLWGICNDANTSVQVLALIEKKSAVKKICTEFNTYDETNTTIKKCTTEANIENKIVSTSITQEDIYQDDPRCIRTNNVDEARPNVEAIFDYTTKGFFKTLIQKAYIDGTTENTEVNSTQYLLAASSLTLTPFTDDFEITLATDEESTQEFCESKFSENWFKLRYQALQDTSIKGYVYNKSGKATRSIKVYSSNSSSSHSILDSFGTSKKSSNWGVAVFNDNYKIIEYKTFNVKDSNTTATEMTNYLTSLSTDTLIAVHTFGDAMTNVYNNNDLKVALSSFGANTTILSNLSTVGSYLLVGKKDSSKLAEKVSSVASITLSYTTDISVDVPFVLSVSDTSSCASNETFLEMTKFEPAYTDYGFTDLGVSESDVNNENYCFLGGSLIQGDSDIDSILNNAGIEAYYQLTSNANTDCNSYNNCLSGEIISTSNCKIHVSDDTQDGSESNSTIPSQTGKLTTFTSQSGSFASEINGYRDIFSIQEYTEGTFGYVSNYIFKLPENNIVLLDGKEVSPIIGQTPTIYDLLYDHANGQHTEKTKNRTPTEKDGSYSGLVGITTQMGDSGIDGNLLVTGAVVAGVASVFTGGVFTAAILVVMMFMGTQQWGWYDSAYKIYQELSVTSKYIENVYGYDPRIIESDSLTWAREEAHSGTLKKSDYTRFRDSVISVKKNYFLNMGFSTTVVNNKMTSTAEKNMIGWGSIKWYELSAKKNKNSESTGVATGINKQINTIYMGAVNMLSIVVPYTGDYEVIAYDKNNNILGTITVQEQNFMKNTTATSGNVAQTYAKVQFATAENFNISDGQNKQYQNGSCLASDFVEWGGGVSGAYYESGVPDLGVGSSDCLKSNDVYVKEHSAVKVTVRSLESSVPFVIDLVKPLPFSNKVYLVNMSEQENREYQCFSSLEPCEVN